MDCRTARLLLDFGRPLSMELEEREAESLQEHLADCPDCGSLAQAERTADHAIGQVMRAVPVPAEIRGRVLARLRADVRVGRERRWWVASGVAAAAACLVAAWVGLGWTGRPADVDVVQLGRSIPLQALTNTPNAVEDYFHAAGKPVPVPRNLQYGQLVYYGLENVQGREVPLLVFVHGKDQARVYVLSDRQFKLDPSLAEEFGGGSQYRVALQRSPAHPHVAYLILYTGDSLQPFLAEGGSSPTL